MAQVRAQKYGGNLSFPGLPRGWGYLLELMGRGFLQCSWTGDRQNPESHRLWSFSSSSQSRKITTHNSSPPGCLPTRPKPSCVTRSQGPHSDPHPIPLLWASSPPPSPALSPYLSFLRKSKPGQAPLHPVPGQAWGPVLLAYLMVRPYLQLLSTGHCFKFLQGS